MSNNLLITSTEAQSGKTAVAIGVMEILLQKIKRVGFFRPIISVDPNTDQKDNDLELMAARFKLKTPYEDMYGLTATEAGQAIAANQKGRVADRILDKYDRLASQYDFILMEGTDFTFAAPSLERDYNAEIARLLGCPVLLVAKANGKSLETTYQNVELYIEAFQDKNCEVMAVVINRIHSGDREAIIGHFRDKDITREMLVQTIPYQRSLGNPTVREVATQLGAQVLYGHDQLNRHVHQSIVAAMQLRHFLKYIDHGTLVIVPGDRADVIVACLAAVSAETLPNISGMVFTGGLQPEEPVWQLIKGFRRMVPIISVQDDTFAAARRIDQIQSTITPGNERKITRALNLFERNVDQEALAEKVITAQTEIISPKMFEFGLIHKAKAQKRHIVLPEGEEGRILQAAEILLQRDVVELTLLGDPRRIESRIMQLGLLLDNINIINPQESDYLEDFVQTYYELRKHKGLTWENAQDTMVDVSFFGTMMVHKGLADGMVSGSIHTTRHTIRPAFEIIKTKPGVSIVSSAFFMCLEDRVLVYGDCAINPDPNASQLAEIAISSAKTALKFGLEPRVAMLSYSTGESGIGEDVNKVREATRIARGLSEKEFPGLKIEGPIQYDAAVDMAVAKTKMPDSDVAGKATVFIFPDLNTGNNTYKAVQRSAGAVAIGPVLQGLNRPVNDLSRGCQIPDIVNTVAITAIQAQEEA